MLRTIRARLVLLALLTLAPFVAIAGHAAATAWRLRQHDELVANLELARTTATLFRTFVDAVLHECNALGTALATGAFAPGDADALLARAAGDRGAVRQYDWVAPDGRVLRSSNPAAIGLSLADRDEVRRILAGEEGILSDLMLGKTDGRPVFAVARGVRLPGRGLAGVLVAVVDPDRLGDRAMPIAREGDGSVALVDRNGRLAFRAPALDLSWEARRIAPAQPIVSSALAGDEATGRVHAETGDVRLAAAVPVRGHGWAVRAGRPSAEALGPVRREIVLLVLVGAVVSILVLVVATAVGRHTGAAVRRLEQHARAVGRGEAPPPLRGPAEVVRLGKAYEAMAAEVSAAQAAARSRVEADRRRLEAVLRTLPVGVFIADASGQLLQANDAARRIWAGKAAITQGGILESRARWTDTAERIPTDEWPLLRALRTGEPCAGRLIDVDRPDGTTVTILSQAAPVRDADGRVAGAVATFQDVSELRKAVRHRDEVLQVVSHDLRTPLGTVVLGAASLARTPDGPEALERTRLTAARIAAAGRRMNRLIDDLLDLSGLDEGRLSIRRAPTDALDLLGEAADQVREAAREKGLDLCLSAAPGLPAVDCDRDRVLQVLGNVASNAVSATPAGCVCLAAEAQGGVVVFRVRDTGPGIPAEDLPLVFERGRRGEGARWRGAGLGLAIARALVEAHGGRIWAESVPGEGATVSFTLPVAADEGALALGVA